METPSLSHPKQVLAVSVLTPDYPASAKRIYDKEVDFRQEMLKKLLSAGFSRRSLAVALQTSVTTINSILNGKTKKNHPKMFTSLLRLYCSLLGYVEKQYN